MQPQESMDTMEMLGMGFDLGSFHQVVALLNVVGKVSAKRAESLHWGN